MKTFLTSVSECSFVSISFICRLSGIKLLKRLVKAGSVDLDWFAQPPEVYIQQMSRTSEFVDSLFLNVLATLLKHDIIVVHMHEETVANKLFNWIHGGGQIGEGIPSKNCPVFLCKFLLFNVCTMMSSLVSIHIFPFFKKLFLVYFEDGVYCQGHFQSIVPTRKSETLEAILDEGGFDVADFLKLPDHGEFITVSSFKLLYY